jgi:hypothetical protein
MSRVMQLMRNASARIDDVARKMLSQEDYHALINNCLILAISQLMPAAAAEVIDLFIRAGLNHADIRAATINLARSQEIIRSNPRLMAVADRIFVINVGEFLYHATIEKAEGALPILELEAANEDLVGAGSFSLGLLRQEIARNVANPGYLERLGEMAKEGKITEKEAEVLEKYPGLMALFAGAIDRSIFYSYVPQPQAATGWGGMESGDWKVARVLAQKMAGCRSIAASRGDGEFGIIYLPAMAAGILLAAWDALGEKNQADLARF